MAKQQCTDEPKSLNHSGRESSCCDTTSSCQSVWFVCIQVERWWCYRVVLVKASGLYLLVCVWLLNFLMYHEQLVSFIRCKEAFHFSLSPPSSCWFIISAHAYYSVVTQSVNVSFILLIYLVSNAVYTSSPHDILVPLCVSLSPSLLISITRLYTDASVWCLVFIVSLPISAEFVNASLMVDL